MSYNDVSSSLGLSESTVFWASAVLILGLVGEYFDEERWKKLVAYTVAKLCVVLAVFVELLGTSAEFRAAARLHEMDEAKINATTVDAARALDSAFGTYNKVRWRVFSPAQCAKLRLSLNGIYGDMIPIAQ